MKRFCLLRWREGNTAAKLASWGTPSAGHQDPVTGASLCGPLAIQTDLSSNTPEHLRGLGFPCGEIGDVELFETPEQAAACATWDGFNMVAIDLPAPIDALHFGVDHYRYWDGKTETVYDGGDLRQARAEKALRLSELGKEAIRNKVQITCRPNWEALRAYAPTPEQVARLNETDRQNVERNRELAMRDSA